MHSGCGILLKFSYPVFRAVIERCVDMDEREHAEWVRQARRFAANLREDAAVLEQNRNLFDLVGY